ncbi:hypothetical protein [Streptococcus suis]|uniref:hypothetical protein n=1 Tax=Streptococcus suis TaxID=1307 RepID=UPI001E6454D1|nr:hypothetical protein [Streptococcus suis]
MMKNKGGRPTKMTQGTVKKLEEAFLRGLSDEEACLYANQPARKTHSLLTEKNYLSNVLKHELN